MRLAAIRQLDPLDRLRQVFELSEAMRALALAGLRAAHPDCSERELVEQLLARSLNSGRPVPRDL